MFRTPLKIRIFLIFSISVFFSNSIYSQKADSIAYVDDNDTIREPIYKFQSCNIIKTNPLVILQGSIPFGSEFRLNYETYIAPKQNIELGISYIGKGILLWANEDSTTSSNPAKSLRGFRLQAQYRWYPLQEDLEPMGYYISLHTSYSCAKYAIKQVVITKDYLRIEHYNLNLLLGYQTEIIEPFSLDVFAGIGIKKNSWYEHINKNNFKSFVPEIYNWYVLDNYYNSNFKIIVGFNLGFIIN